jgi:hypothetical protein
LSWDGDGKKVNVALGGGPNGETGGKNDYNRNLCVQMGTVDDTKWKLTKLGQSNPKLGTINNSETDNTLTWMRTDTKYKTEDGNLVDLPKSANKTTFFCGGSLMNTTTGEPCTSKEGTGCDIYSADRNYAPPPPPPPPPTNDYCDCVPCGVVGGDGRARPFYETGQCYPRSDTCSADPKTEGTQGCYSSTDKKCDCGTNKNV